MNSIWNCPVIKEDLAIAENIYGPDVASLKGKATRARPTPVVHDTISIPPELIEAQRNVELCIDTLFVNNMPFLTTISKHIMYRTATWIPSREITSYRSVIEKILAIYTVVGFHVKQISCDCEFDPV